MSFLRSFTHDSVPPPATLIESSVGGTQRITVWTDQPQIIFRVIPPVSINVIRYNRDLSCLYVYLFPSADTALIAILRTQISLNVTGYHADTEKSRYFSGLPLTDEGDVLVFHLTGIAAIQIAIPSSFIRTGSADTFRLRHILSIPTRDYEKMSG